MGADVQFRVWDPVLSVMMVKDLIAATRMTAQNAMTKTLMKKSLREIQVEKLRIGEQLLVRTAPKPWALGVKVTARERWSCSKSIWPWTWPRKGAGKVGGLVGSRYLQPVELCALSLRAFWPQRKAHMVLAG